MKSIKIRILIILSFLSLCNSFVYADCNGVWEIWLIPNKYRISLGDTIKIRFGITGYGDIDIYKSKFTIYSEKETLLSIGKEKEKEIFISFLEPKPNSTTSLYITDDTNNVIKKNYIGLKSDYLTSFKDINIHPKSCGDKKVEFVFTYNCGGEWKIVSKTFNYHVNSWSEDNETWINIFYLLGVVLIILAFTPNNYISKFIKKIFKRR